MPGMEESIEAIHQLIAKASDKYADAKDALQFSQAACNVANALAVIKDIDV